MPGLIKYLSPEDIQRLLAAPPHKIILTTSHLLSRIFMQLDIPHRYIHPHFDFGSLHHNGLLHNQISKIIILHRNDNIIEIRYFISNDMTKMKIDLTEPDSIERLHCFLIPDEEALPAEP